MKISDVKLRILENPDRQASTHRLVEVPGLRRIQYTHQGIALDRPAQQAFLEVRTDEGLWGRCTTGMTPGQAEILRNNVTGEDPLDRERLYLSLIHISEPTRPY